MEKNNSNLIMLFLVLVLVVLSIAGTYSTLSSANNTPVDNTPVDNGKISFSVMKPSEPVSVNGKVGLSLKSPENGE